MKLASHFTSCLFSFDVREAMKRGVNRPTDQRILKIILLGFRIQSKISTDLRILNLQRFAVSSIFWVRILDFACEEVRIVDRKGFQKMRCFWVCVFFLSRPDETHFMSRIREIITNYGQHEERRRICITWTWQTPSKLHGLVNMLVLKMSASFENGCASETRSLIASILPTENRHFRLHLTPVVRPKNVFVRWLFTRRLDLHIERGGLNESLQYG